MFQIDPDAPPPRQTKRVKHNYPAIIEAVKSAKGSAVRVEKVSNVTVFSRTLHQRAEGMRFRVYRVGKHCYVRGQSCTTT